MSETAVPLLHDELAPERGTEALFEEARRRTRRRRLRACGAAALLVLAAAGAGHVLAGGGGTAPATRPETATQPFVNIRAFRDAGDLAFVSRGSLWVLDGATGSLRRIASSRHPLGALSRFGLVAQGPTSPAFSPDGRWLAYLVAGGGPAQLWIARADGSHAHLVHDLPVDQMVGWSPTADVLAVTTEVGELPHAVSLVTPGGAVRSLLSRARPQTIWSAVWSPNGADLAVSTADLRPRGRTTVDAYPVDGGPPTPWFSIRTDRRLPDALRGRGAGGTIADLAGWWPGFGIGFWDFNSGATHNNDDTPLELLTAPGARPRLIARTLSDGATDAIAAAPPGALALVSSTQDGRELGQGKAVQSCDRATLTCSPLPGATVWNGGEPQTRCPDPCRLFGHPPSGAPGSGVSLDPAWSPQGTLLAYVKAPVALTGGNPTLPWYGAHELFVYDRASGATRRLARVDGAQVPTWSADGRDLLYVAGDGLWLVPARGGRPVEIEHPLYPQAWWRALPASPLAYYGQIPWDAQFTWWSADRDGRTAA